MVVEELKLQDRFLIGSSLARHVSLQPLYAVESSAAYWLHARSDQFALVRIYDIAYAAHCKHRDEGRHFD